jgi:protein-disulfide isomerase
MSLRRTVRVIGRAGTPVAGAVALLLALGVTAACDLAADGGSSGTAATGTAGAAVVAGDTVPGVSVDVGYTLGDADAPIAVVEFSDFGCPYCARFARTTMPELERDYIDRGLVRWRYVPVVFGFPGGGVGAAAAECVAREGGAEAFWRIHDIFYTRQVVLRGENARPQVLEWIEEEGLDSDAVAECMDDPATRALLERNNEAAQQWFVRGTPSFIVNGVPMSGALPVEFFRQVFATVLDPSGL